MQFNIMNVYILSSNSFSPSSAMNHSVNHTERKEKWSLWTTEPVLLLHHLHPPSQFPPGVHHTKSCSVSQTIPGVLTKQHSHKGSLCSGGRCFAA